MWLSSCGALVFQDWWQSMSAQIVTSCDWQREQHDSVLHLLVLYAHNNVSIYFFYTLWKRIESFIEYYLIIYWMLLLLLLVVYNNSILLTVLLIATDRKSIWSLYMAMLLLLLLAIDKRPTGFVVMAWHPQRDLTSQFFNNAVVEDKTIGWYCHNTGQHQLGFSVCCAPHQLLLYRGLRKISSGANLAPESLRTVSASGTL